MNMLRIKEQQQLWKRNTMLGDQETCIKVDATYMYVYLAINIKD